MKTKIITEDIEAAAEIIKGGGLVAVPTETVYGLACNGLDAKAVERVYEVKGRPEVKPLSLMVPGPGAISRYCVDAPPGRIFPCGALLARTIDNSAEILGNCPADCSGRGRHRGPSVPRP